VSNPDTRWLLPPAFTKEDQEHFAAHAKGFQEREVRRAKRGSWLAWGCVAGFAGLAYLQGGALYYAVPNIRIQPVYFFKHPDGTMDAVSNEAALPQTMTEADTRAWLWQYVLLRERYNWADARDDYDVVSAMSAPDVREHYQTFQNNHIPGAPSPAKALGKTGILRVLFRDSDLSGDTFTARYCRVVELDGQRPMITPWIVKLHFQTLDKVTTLQRLQYNPHALIVTSYPGPEQQGTGGDASGDCLPAMGG
jgi:type IV secretion system protein VirB8